MAPITEIEKGVLNIQLDEFQKDAEMFSSSSEEFSMSPNDYRRDIADKFINITYFDSRKYPNCNSAKGTIGAVSNFSTNLSSLPKNSKNSKCHEYSDSEDSDDSDGDGFEEWAKTRPDLLDVNPKDSISKRMKNSLRRNSAYLGAAPVKRCK
mmetsp:Transcript_22850/g.25393  ORF Transcript_22850/g.25393 Transcript_22850/m.25393 type:complete len:152 (+) Transcript_22850:104-559(+)|eukprot:CAMPEP_0205803482 /NCGR_PEP_ID=MMETSP0205-20121125/6145_1 /ASSEMBLY_ACC=CAM_ASM_000278 /TAXON_ID=36767 /ORGANISM="Euplotes focardii, Strain TN1" /LENGTH=151 /DNA_ID=CAMNT_0053071623 /DNA_START=132 /DNA_END=587 /DNA_ORIENTATION=-